MLTLSLAPMVIGFMVVGFLIVSLLMILIVLIQRPQGGGLSEAFGSNSGSGHTAFGAKTGDALTTATIGIFVLFIVAAIVLNFATRPTTGPAQAAASETPVDQLPQPEQAPQGAAGDAAPAEGEGGRTELEVTQLDGAPTVGDLPGAAGEGDAGSAEGGEEESAPEEPASEDAPE